MSQHMSFKLGKLYCYKISRIGFCEADITYLLVTKQKVACFVWQNVRLDYLII